MKLTTNDTAGKTEFNLNAKAPITLAQRKQLMMDAENIRATAERKSVTLDDWDQKQEAAAAIKYFELGCWLNYYKPLIGREGGDGLQARIDCAMRLCLSGVNNPRYNFFTVFDFGERDFDTLFEMYDGHDVVEALRKAIPNDKSGNLLKAFEYFGWPVEVTPAVDEKSRRIVHGPETHPQEWKGGIYMGSDGYTMHLDAGGFFDEFPYEPTQSNTAEAPSLNDTQAGKYLPPDMCFAVVPEKGPGNYIVAIKRDEAGCFPTTYDEMDLDKASELVKYMNAVNLNLSEAQAEAMLVGSMFGWHCKGAQDPGHADPLLDDGLDQSSRHQLQALANGRPMKLIDFPPECVRKVSYEGVIIGMTDRYVVQNQGLSVNVFPKENLDAELSEGANVRISFFNNTLRGVVEDIKSLSNDIAR